MPHESYHGINVRLRYLLRVTMQRSYGAALQPQTRVQTAWFRT